MKKKIITLLVTSMLTLSMFGCSSENNKTDDVPKTTKATSESAEEGSKDVEQEQIQESTEEATTEEMKEFVFYVDGKEYILPQTLGELKNMLGDVAIYEDYSFYFVNENGEITYDKWGYIENTKMFNVWFTDDKDVDDNSNIETVNIASDRVSIPGGIVEWYDESLLARDESDAKYIEIKATLEGMGYEVVEESGTFDYQDFDELKVKVSDKEYYEISFAHKTPDDSYESIGISLERDED